MGTAPCPGENGLGKQGNVHSNSRRVEPSRRGTEVRGLEPGEPGGAREAGTQPDSMLGG